MTVSLPSPSTGALSALALFFLSACSSAPPYQGQGEYFELSTVHLIERDLSPLRPAELGVSTPGGLTPPRWPAAPGEAFLLPAGQSYLTILKGWLAREGADFIAWSLSDPSRAALNAVNRSPIEVRGGLKAALDRLSNESGVRVALVQSHEPNQAQVMAVVDFDGPASLMRLSGRALSQVLQAVTEHYGYVWVPGNDPKRSYLAPTDYHFGADYYLVTREGDIDTALEDVLSGYPLHASIVETTGQVFIEETL